MIERDTGRERLPGGPEGVANGVPVAAPDAPAAPEGPTASDGTRAASDTPRANAVPPAREDASARPTGPSGPSGPSGGAVVPAGGVNTLRAILLGGSPRTPDDARLTAIERRLDTLSLQLAREPRVAGEPVTASASPVQAPADDARLAEIERQLAAHDARLDAANSAARGSDVTLATLEALRQQLDVLRVDHAALTEQTANRLREADIRCQLRQLRVRSARSQELRRLRRLVYAPASALVGAPGQPRAATPANAPAIERPRPADVRPPVWPVPLGSPLPAADSPASVPAMAATAAWAGATRPSAAATATDVNDAKAQHAVMRRELDLAGARHALGGSLAALMRSLATLAVVTVRLAGSDLRALWAWLTHGRHAEGNGREPDQRREPFRD